MSKTNYLNCVSGVVRWDKHEGSRHGAAPARRLCDRRSNCTTPVYVPAITNLSFCQRHFLAGDTLFCDSKYNITNTGMVFLCYIVGVFSVGVLSRWLHLTKLCFLLEFSVICWVAYNHWFPATGRTYIKILSVCCWILMESRHKLSPHH